MRSIDQLDAWITTKVRAWSSKISGTPRSTDLIEIRRDILKDVRDHIEPKGGGKLVFPYNTIAVHLTAESDRQREMLEGAFGQDNDLEETISALLREAGCAPPAGLHVAVSVGEAQTPEDTEHALRIDYSNSKSAAKERLPDSRPHAKLAVLRGEADAAEYAIHADRTNLGRLKEVVGDRDGLRRRNDVAFSENETTFRENMHLFVTRVRPASSGSMTPSASAVPACFGREGDSWYPKARHAASSFDRR